MIPILDLTKQYEIIKDEVESKVLDVLRSGCYIMGPNVKTLEQDFAEFCGTSRAVSVASGTDALVLALRALDIGPGDEVITVSFSFFATAECIGLVGATPVFVDINKDTFNINIKEIEKKITPKTKAIIPVHLYGQPADMDPILEIAQKYNLYVIEDCAQAVGAEYKGKKVGSLGDVGCFSFFPSKNLGAAGDGGIIATNSTYIADRISALRVHGGSVRYYHQELGYTSRLDEIQAAVLNVKMKYIKKWNSQRQEAAYRYNAMLKGVEGVITPTEINETSCVYHQYTLQVEQRDKVHELMKDKGIMTMIYYPVPIHKQEAFRYLDAANTILPTTDELMTKVLSLPMFPEITEEQQKQVTDALKECFSELKDRATV